MRIIVNGQQAFGASVLKALVERGEDIVGVYTRPEKPGQRPDPLADAAREHGCPCSSPPPSRARIPGSRCGRSVPIWA